MGFNWQPVKNIDYIINYYKILELAPEASEAEIKAQYKSLAQQYHPDKFQKAGEEIRVLSAKKMSLIAEAYAILSKPETKSLYDLQLQKFQKDKPKCISEDGIAILDLSSESLSLDFLISGQVKFDFQETQESKANLLIGFNPMVLDMMEKAYQADVNNEDIKKAYLEQLTKKKLHLDWQERFAWQELGVMNSSDIKVSGVLDYLSAVEKKLEQVQNQLNKNAEVRLLGVETQPLLLSDNRSINQASENSLSVVKEEITKVFSERKEKLIKIAQEKQEFLNKYLKVRTCKMLVDHEGKDLSLVLYQEDNTVLVQLVLMFDTEGNPCPLESCEDLRDKNIDAISEYKMKVYALKFNPEIDLILQALEYLNELVQE